MWVLDQTTEPRFVTLDAELGAADGLRLRRDVLLGQVVLNLHVSEEMGHGSPPICDRTTRVILLRGADTRYIDNHTSA